MEYAASRQHSGSSSGEGFCSMMVSFGKRVAKPSSDTIHMRRAMAIGSSIRLLYLLFRATFLRLCSCNRTRIVDVLLASRHHEYSGFVRCAGRGFPDLILKPDMMERDWRKWSRTLRHNGSLRRSTLCKLNHNISHTTWSVEKHAVKIKICIPRPSNVQAKAGSADVAGTEARQAMERSYRL